LDRWVTEALLDHIDVAGLTLWEPATGLGHMAAVLKASPAKQVFCSDIVARTYPLDAIHDFTTGQLPAGLEYAPDGIVTNPPLGIKFKLAAKFIEAGLDHLGWGGFLALLLPANFDCAKERRKYFIDCPQFHCRLALTKRPVWFSRNDGKEEAPKEDCAWMIWRRDPLQKRVPPRLLYGPSDEFYRVNTNSQVKERRRIPPVC
jgi:hypothetical protein